METIENEHSKSYGQKYRKVPWDQQAEVMCLCAGNGGRQVPPVGLTRGERAATGAGPGCSERDRPWPWPQAPGCSSWQTTARMATGRNQHSSLLLLRCGFPTGSQRAREPEDHGLKDLVPGSRPHQGNTFHHLGW